jgi:UDP-N-acetylglucosamine transferase subunit ALG13
MIFVVLGTQKFQFDRLLAEIDRLVETGTIQEEVFIQRGHSNYTGTNCGSESFLTYEDFQRCVEKCDLMITHSGVASIISGLKHGKPVIVVPRQVKFGEHVDDHQIQIAESFMEQNFVLLCKDTANLAALIQKSKTHQFSRYISQRDRVIREIRDYLDLK